jgi:hypothetical protein
MKSPRDTSRFVLGLPPSRETVQWTFIVGQADSASTIRFKHRRLSSFGDRLAVEDGMTLLNGCELPEAYREPLILRFVEGMTGPEMPLAPAYTWLGASKSSSRHAIASRKWQRHERRWKTRNRYEKRLPVNGSGEPDAGLQRIEKSLAQFRHCGTTPISCRDGVQRTPQFLAF